MFLSLNNNLVHLIEINNQGVVPKLLNCRWKMEESEGLAKL